MIRRFGSWLGWLLVGTVVLVVMVWALGAWSGVILLYVWAAAVRQLWRWLDVLVVGNGGDDDIGDMGVIVTPVGGLYGVRHVDADRRRLGGGMDRLLGVYRGLRGGGGNGGGAGDLPAYRVGPGVGEAVEEGDGEPCEH